MRIARIILFYCQHSCIPLFILNSILNTEYSNGYKKGQHNNIATFMFT